MKLEIILGLYNILAEVSFTKMGICFLTLKILGSKMREVFMLKPGSLKGTLGFLVTTGFCVSKESVTVRILKVLDREEFYNKIIKNCLSREIRSEICANGP